MAYNKLLSLTLFLKFSFTSLDMIDIRIQDNCTLNGAPGLCKYLDQCPSAIETFANPTQEDIKRLQSHMCPSFIPKDISVCCILDSPKKIAEVSDKRYCGFQHFDDLFLDIRQTSIIEFPWVAAIMRTTKDNVTEIACLGALINSRYIVTSGYCASLLQESNNKMWVRLGEFYLQNNTDCVTWTKIRETECSQFEDLNLEKTIPHPFLSQSILSINDIGLLRLEKSVQYSDYVRPICVPTQRVSQKEELFTSGWVSNEFKIKIPADIVKNSACDDSNAVLAKYNGCIRYQRITDSTDYSCTFLNNGAPIMYQHKGQWHLEGISYMYFNKNNECISRYTPIAPYFSWIRNNVEDY